MRIHNTEEKKKGQRLISPQSDMLPLFFPADWFCVWQKNRNRGGRPSSTWSRDLAFTKGKQRKKKKKRSIALYAERRHLARQRRTPLNPSSHPSNKTKLETQNAEEWEEWSSINSCVVHRMYNAATSRKKKKKKKVKNNSNKTKNSHKRVHSKNTGPHAVRQKRKPPAILNPRRKMMSYKSESGPYTGRIHKQRAGLFCALRRPDFSSIMPLFLSASGIRARVSI